MKICKELAFQGDIGLLAINKLPEGCSKISHKLNSSDREAYGYHQEKGLVLAQGESRNHYHAFREIDKVEMYELKGANDNKRLFLVINEATVLSHEEHDPIKFEPNVYELFFQFEYNFEEEYQRVAD